MPQLKKGGSWGRSPHGTRREAAQVLKSAIAGRQYPQARAYAAGWATHNKCLSCLHNLTELGARTGRRTRSANTEVTPTAMHVNGGPVDANIMPPDAEDSSSVSMRLRAEDNIAPDDGADLPAGDGAARDEQPELQGRGIPTGTPVVRVVPKPRNESTVLEDSVQRPTKQDKVRFKVEASDEQIAAAPVGNLGHRIWTCKSEYMQKLRNKWAAPEDVAILSSCEVEGHPA